MRRKLTLSMLYRLLGHAGLGATMLVILSPSHMVAYIDSEYEFVSLCQEMLEMNYSVQVGIQPRQVRNIHEPLNQWISVTDNTIDTLTDDRQIEYITMGHIQIGPFPPYRPVSPLMLKKSYETARAIANQPEISSHAVVVGTDSGHHVLVPMVPIQVDTKELARRYKYFWQEMLIRAIQGLDKGLSVTSVFRLGDTMPLITGICETALSEKELFSNIELGNDRSHELHQRIIKTSLSRIASINNTVDLKPVKRKRAKQHNNQISLWPDL